MDNTEPLSPKANATRLVFEALAQSGIAYAVLRNYEQFPDFGHDVDLVLPDVPAWRLLLTQLAAVHRWKAVYECSHWAQSAYAAHRIDVFRIYTADWLDYLQIDCFHSFPLYGLALFSQEALLAGRFYDERGFWRINPDVESVFRLLQIHQLRRRNQPEKVARYGQRVLQHAAERGDAFETFLVAVLGAGGKRALQALKAGRWEAFHRAMRQAKWWYFLTHGSRRPLVHGGELLARLLDRLSIQFLSPCGNMVPYPVHTALPALLEGLKAAAVIFDYKIKRCPFFLRWVYKWRHSAFFERNGLWIIPAPAQSDLDAHPSTLISTLEKRHQCLIKQH